MISEDEGWHDSGLVDVPDADLTLDRVGRLKKSPTAFRTISEVADDLHVPQHVLRFWETRFPQVKPLKRGGGRRYYRPDDVVLLRRISDLLYIQGYTIKGVQRLLLEGHGILQDPLPPPEKADAERMPEMASEPAVIELPDEVASTATDLATLIGPGGATDIQMLRETFRATLNGILDELEAIRRLLPA